MEEKKKIPSPVHFFLKIPLYEEFIFDDEQVWNILDIKYFKGTLDSYCKECKKEATFKGLTPDRPPGHIPPALGPASALRSPTIEEGLFEVKLQCTRHTMHYQKHIFLIRFFLVKPDRSSPTKMSLLPNGKPEKWPPLLVKNKTIQKIGQYPSYGDLNIPKVKKYVSILSEKNLGELTRAIGLASHDIGIGSYIYLRRVFESLIEEAHQNAIKEKGWKERKYTSARMSEKIKMLKKYLPQFLIKNPNMYSLLSKGVHELTEEECLKHFDTLKISIELILDEKLERAEKEKKIMEAEKALQKAIEETS